ncbi:hypothetical protein LWF01_13690 [Saxibacter everestensis]|uniref:Uncharacterized protein n=1 Tax=Saxibacter everestensis TaxID=2909229 RepID=A0ABY8QS47_9MICO|nr:hypothetical protein LWF01_13690 [Brevibacteriaceae bacterium ZFBP1038]
MPAFYLMFAGVIGVIAAAFMPETARKPLQGSMPAVETEGEAKPWWRPRTTIR